MYLDITLKLNLILLNNILIMTFKSDVCIDNDYTVDLCGNYKLMIQFSEVFYFTYGYFYSWQNLRLLIQTSKLISKSLFENKILI